MKGTQGLLSEEAKDTLALYGVPGVGAKTHARLLDYFGSPADVFAAPLSRLMELDGIGEKTAEAIRSFDRNAFIAGQVRRMDEVGAQLLMRNDSAYPAKLASFRSAPPVLFVRGDTVLLDRPGVAFVGTRRTSSYGVNMTRTLVAGSVAAGLSIISGMAAGVDTAAHSTALVKGGVTVAVFGCGVDTIYPSENRNLAKEIEKTGCLVSHFPMGTPAMSGNFPARNAVVVGLSLGTVVIEAPERSGALITADLTLRAGRPLMTVPGNIDSPTSAGTNRLLERGARPVMVPADIPRALDMPSYDMQQDGVGLTEVRSAPDLPGLAGKIMNTLGNGAMQIEEIGQQLGNPISELLTELTMLEMDGHVLQKPGKVFERC